MDSLGPVVIGPREIYDKLVLLESAVSRLADKAADADRDHADHEARLRALERARWPLPSIAVLVSLVALALPMLGR